MGALLYGTKGTRNSSEELSSRPEPNKLSTAIACAPRVSYRQNLATSSYLSLKYFLSREKSSLGLICRGRIPRIRACCLCARWWKPTEQVQLPTLNACWLSASGPQTSAC